LKIVGLKIEKGRVSAAVVDKGLRRSELKDSFSLPFRTDAELADLLREKARGWAGARIVSSIPGNHFTQRAVTFPFGDRTRVEKALPFEVEDDLPFPLDDVLLDHIVPGRADTGGGKKTETAVVGIILPKAVLRPHLELLASAGLDPQVVVPSYLGLLSVAEKVPVEGVAVLVDGNDLCVKEGNIVKACRSFSAAQAAGGLRHTLKALEIEHGLRIEKAVLLVENNGLRAELAGLGLAVEQAMPDFGGRKAEDATSLGLALSEEVNFRKGEFSYRLADAGARKRRRALLVAATAVALLAAANIGVKYYLVQASYNKLDLELKELYRQAVPDAKTAVDPVRQLRTRLNEAQKKFGVLGSGSSALEAMKAVTDGIPLDVRISFQEFLLEGDRLKLNGEASSFEALDKIKAELQKTGAFAEVAVLDTRLGVDNKVKFRFELKLLQAM
jgi:general secretion pathway protein L